MSNLEETKEFLKKHCLQKCKHNSNESCICKVAICFKEIEKAQEQEKVLEIIKKKCIDNINLGLVKHCVSYESYKLCSQNNINANDNIEKENLLTKEEFDLLKRYFNDRTYKS